MSTSNRPAPITGPSSRKEFRAIVPERLLFVTQVAPYRDGPAGVHGVLAQAAVGVGQVAELHGLAARRVEGVRPIDAAALRETRALALFTIGETPWNAEQRAAILDRVRTGTLAILS